MKRILTLKQLEDAGACIPQLAKFQELFGNEVEISSRVCLLHRNTFDFTWAALNLLSETAAELYFADMDAFIRLHAYVETYLTPDMRLQQKALSFARAYNNDKDMKGHSYEKQI